VLGHNLIGFDLPHLQAASPQLSAVDTLRLNPLAFPRNPYHYLVKHYQDGQLKRGRVNDPELDARLALEVFENQQRALSAAFPDLLASWHWLTTADGGLGFDRLFTTLRRSPRPSAGEARDAMVRCLSGSACGTST
jgi:ATP-dependent DNA helicase RecQ